MPQGLPLGNRSRRNRHILLVSLEPRRVKKQSTNFFVDHGDKSNWSPFNFQDPSFGIWEIHITHIFAHLVSYFSRQERMRKRFSAVPDCNQGIGVFSFVFTDNLFAF